MNNVAEEVRGSITTARSGAERLQEAEDTLEDLLGADRASINVQSGKTSIHLTYKHDD